MTLLHISGDPFRKKRQTLFRKQHHLIPAAFHVEPSHVLPLLSAVVKAKVYHFLQLAEKPDHCHL